MTTREQNYQPDACYKALHHSRYQAFMLLQNTGKIVRQSCA